MEVLKKHFDTALESPEGIKKLRELILTLAMQGKLVPQDPKDPPASELLKEIQTEKKKLIADGKIKKQKELPEIKPEEVPYEVPEGWVWTRLGEVGNTNIGLTYSPTNISEQGTIVLRSSNIQNDKLDFTDIVRVNSDIKESVTVQEGDLLICARNGSKHLVGKTALITGLSERMAFGAFMAIFRSRLNYFLLHFINSSLFRKMISEVNTMTINQITQNNLKNTIFPLPPLAEQKRIVAKIDELMALCDKLEKQRASRDQKRLAVHTSAINRLLTAAGKKEFDTSWQFITRHFDPIYSVKENVAELKKAILTLAMQGKLVPQDPNDPPASELLKEIQAEKAKLIVEGKIKKQKELSEIKPEEVPYEVPEGWIWTRLGVIILTITGGGTPSKNNSTFWNGNIPWASVKDLNVEVYLERTIDSITEKAIISSSTNLIPKNSIIVCTRMGLGKIAINKMDVAINQDLKAISLSSLIDQMYFFKNYKNYRIIGTGMTVRGIRQEELLNFFFPLPPLAEQKRIVAKIDELMALCDRLESQIDQATQKQTALFNAVLAKVSTKYVPYPQNFEQGKKP